jgi:hypothetical protein
VSDRFTADDTYDNNGNTTSSGGIADVYDFENHLVLQGGVTIVYDGDGNRVSKTTASGTTQFLVQERVANDRGAPSPLMAGPNHYWAFRNRL